MMVGWRNVPLSLLVSLALFLFLGLFVFLLASLT